MVRADWLEEPYTSAEQHRREVDHDLVEETFPQALLGEVAPKITTFLALAAVRAVATASASGTDRKVTDASVASSGGRWVSTKTGPRHPPP